MTRSSFIALCAAIMLTIASAQTAVTLTAASFAAAPGKVFDGSTGAADVTTWGTYSGATFGPGTTNTTVYAWGWLTSGGSLTKVASRTINATMLSNGTADTTLAASAGNTDAVATLTTAYTSGPQVAVGLGTLGIAYVAADSGCSKVYVAVFTGGSTTPVTKEISGFTCSHCTNGATTPTGTGYSHTIDSIFYENNTYYVSWSSTKYIETSAASATGCTTSSTYPSAVATATSSQPAITGQIFAYLQGVSSKDGTLKWTTPATVYTGATATTTAPSPAESSIKSYCNSGNWTNSTNILCTYYTGASPNVLQYVPVPTATGTAGTATTVATSQTVPPAAAGTASTYTVAGIVHSQYQQGILINNKAGTYSDGAGTLTSTANTLQLYNLTSGATAVAGGVTLNITNTYASGPISGAGLPYSMGWGLYDSYLSAASTATYELGAYFANGTTNGTKVTFASGAAIGQASLFVDVNGALWAGAYSTTSSLLTTGQLGKLVAQVYSASAAGSVLFTFFGLISLVIAALFVF